MPHQVRERAEVEGDLQIEDPSWFPVDLDVRNRAFHILPIAREQLRVAPFLDNRLDVAWTQALRMSVGDVAALAPPRRPAAWLWHTSFCGSTLLARALDVAPWATALKEPMVLRRLSDAFDGGIDASTMIAPTVALLSRPWHPDGKNLIKPTHAALNIGVRLLGETVGDRGVVLTSGLEDFLVSNLKKPPESQAKATTLAERALRTGDFLSRLPPEALAPPDLACAAALQWAAQRELVLDMRLRSHVDLLQLDASALFADLRRAAAECAEWLALDIPEAQLMANCMAVGGVHAKATQRLYDADARAAEKRLVWSQFGGVLRRTLAWVDRHVFPAVRPAALEAS